MDEARQHSTQEINENGRTKNQTEFEMDEIKDMRSNKKFFKLVNTQNKSCINIVLLCFQLSNCILAHGVYTAWKDYFPVLLWFHM